ncbi:MAG: endonuclease domain-containing protein [Pseudomonadota bacterium]
MRNRGFEGLKFRRQSPLAGVVCDFVCPELRLVVELDGGVHALHEVRDAERDARLEEAGFKVVRSSNQAFLSNPNVLLDSIRNRAAEMGKQPPHPSRSASHLLPRGEKD